METIGNKIVETTSDESVVGGTIVAYENSQYIVETKDGQRITLESFDPYSGIRAYKLRDPTPEEQKVIDEGNERFRLREEEYKSKHNGQARWGGSA